MGIFDKLKIKINGVNSSFPINLDQVSTNLWQKINKNWDFEDPLLLFCIITGKDYKEVCNQKVEQKSFETIVKVTNWLYRYVIIDEKGKKVFGFPEIPIPSQILGIEVPKLVGEKTSTMSKITMGQVFLNNKVYSDTDNIQTKISLLVANVMQPLQNDKNEWDSAKVYELEKQILNLPITQTFPLAVFFCEKFPNFVMRGLKY